MGQYFKLMTRRGFVAPFILIVVLLLAVAGGAYYLGRSSLPALLSSPTPQAITAPTLAPSPSPSLRPTITPVSNVKTLTYYLPTGWKTVQDKSGKIEIGYDPTQLFPSSDETRATYIFLLPKNGDRYRTGVWIAPYDGGSRHKFIWAYTWDQKSPTYHESNYSYNGWSCLVVYGAYYSMSAGTHGMCAISNTQGLAIETMLDKDTDVEQVMRTIKILK